MERETYADSSGNKTTVQRGDEFSIRRFFEGIPLVSRWRVDDIKGYDVVTSMITALETDAISVELLEGKFVNAFGKVADFKPGDRVNFSADSVVFLLKEEKEKIKNSKK